MEEEEADNLVPIPIRPTEPVHVEFESLEAEKGRTEAANALRLADQYGDSLRYVTEWGAWIVWDGRRWERDTGGVQVQKKAAEVVNGLWHELANSEAHLVIKKQMSAFVTASNSAKGIANVVTLARSSLPISVGRLDTNPWLLNVADGTLDLKTGELRDERQRDYITKLCPTEYDPDARCPSWEKFLKGVFKDDTELIGYVQRLLGYGLTGDVREQILPILWGTGSNGKSTFVNAVMHVLGPDYGGAPPRELFTVQRYGTSHPTSMMTLQGKRLMAAQETDAGAQLNEALIKHLTGGDKVTARGMYENFSSFDPTHKLLLSTNHKPQVRGTDYAMWRRLKLIPFAVKFEGAAIDKTLPDKLRAEAPGILAWMVRGCLEWQQDGLREPTSVADATKQYATEQDEVGQFIKECCLREVGHTAHATRLYTAFKTANPDSELTQTAFGRDLAQRGFTKSRFTSGANKAQHCWKGLKLIGE